MAELMKEGQSNLMNYFLKFINETINHNNTAAVILQEVLF